MRLERRASGRPTFQCPRAGAHAPCRGALPHGRRGDAARCHHLRRERRTDAPSHFEAINDDTLSLRDAHCPAAKVSVLSNATQIHREEVRRALLRVDNNILKLDSAFDATVRRIDNPQNPAYAVRDIVREMKRFEGRMILQTMFLRGVCNGEPVDNTTEEEVSAWLRLVEEIRPQKVMVYSLDRDTPCPTLEKVPREELQAIAARVEALGIPCPVA